MAAEPLRDPAQLAARARRLLADLAVERTLEGPRRRFLLAQVEGLRTTALKLAGKPISYVDEVEQCYGVRPTPVPEDELAAAHRRLDEVLPGSGPLPDRYVAWREAQVVPVEKLGLAVDSLAEEFRARTAAMWGLPEGEHVEFELITDAPWSGFNYYLGGLQSRVALNLDLPVLSPSLGHLVAHEAYPGHHTEHCRKEISLVSRRRQLEETIFLVGTPQCLVAEGLADLGLEIIAGRRPEPLLADVLHSAGVTYDADLIAQLAEAGEMLGRVRGNAALLLHDQGMDASEVVDYVARWSLVSRARAEKAVQFLTDPTWRAYIFCYVEGLPLCRQFVGDDPARFRRLISEQLTPADLAATPV